MNLSRRDLGLLLPALAAAGAAAQERQTRTLPAKMYHTGQIPYTNDSATAQKKGRRFFLGANRSGFNLEMHETILGPGVETHAPHRHVHEEIIILLEGTVDTYLDGKTETIAAGSVAYFGSNLMHNIRNSGTVPCRYYIVELRGDQA